MVMLDSVHEAEQTPPVSELSDRSRENMPIEAPLVAPVSRAVVRVDRVCRPSADSVECRSSKPPSISPPCLSVEGSAARTNVAILFPVRRSRDEIPSPRPLADRAGAADVVLFRVGVVSVALGRSFVTVRVVIVVI